VEVEVAKLDSLFEVLSSRDPLRFHALCESLRKGTYRFAGDMLEKYLTKKFGEGAMKSIFYHEIIHWLRLMPYKIEKNGERSAMFYAGMIMVMDDIEQRYMAKKGKKK